MPPTTPGEPDRFTGAHAQRRLAVIMFTDMVGYSALSQRDERLALELLEEHRALVRPLLARHGGREIKTIGDAFLVEFSSALAAVTCAVEIQQALHERNRAAPADRRILLRIGLHAGDVIHRENDVYGDGVNIAARLEPLAEPGGICLSEDVARPIRNKGACALVKLGTGELKNISVPVELYRVVLPWSAARPALADRMAFGWRRKSTRRAAAAVAAVAVAVGLAVLLVLRRAPAGPAGPAPANRLAVLPLVSFSGDAHDESFADGMTEELISSLATVRQLNVIARTSIAKFKGSKLDIAEIGQALNVGSILEGTIRVAGDQARINVSLIEVASQKTLWAQEYTRMIKDVFAVQSAIAQSVTDALRVQLLSGERDRLGRRATDNSEAYRQYLLGRSHLNKRTGEEVVQAIDCFQHAIEQDAALAPAYAGLAECYTLAGSAGYANLPRAAANTEARAAARKAVELDDALAEAHAALAYVRFRVDWDWNGAESEFRRAIELKPGYAKTHELYALFLAIRKRFPEATAEMNQARQLDPLSPSVSNGLGRIAHFQRHFDEALRQFQRTLEVDPQYAEAYFSIGMTHVAQHRYGEAVADLQTALRLSGNRPVIVSMLGLTQAQAGHREEAIRIRDDLLAQYRQSATSSYFVGLVEAGLGDLDQAFEYINRAYDEREGILIYLAVDPVTSVLWPDPRFKALVRKMDLVF